MGSRGEQTPSETQACGESMLFNEGVAMPGGRCLVNRGNARQARVPWDIHQGSKCLEDCFCRVGDQGVTMQLWMSCYSERCVASDSLALGLKVCTAVHVAFVFAFKNYCLLRV